MPLEERDNLRIDHLSEDEKLEELMHPERYMFSPHFGALFRDERVQEIMPWLEEAGRVLPFVFGSPHLYTLIESLPEPSPEILDSLTPGQIHRAFKRYYFLTSAWLKNHSHGKALRPEIKTIPRNLARPFAALSKKLGIPPILPYGHYVAGNLILKNADGPFDIENLCAEQLFVHPQRIPDEQGFIVVHGAIEYHGRVIPLSAGPCKRAMQRRNHRLVTACLWTVGGATTQMYAELLKMPLWCGPDIYYREVRLQIQLFSDVMYEGIGDPEFQKSVSLRGESGAGSTTLEAARSFLNISEEKEDALAQHRKALRSHMLPRQRAFIELIEATPSVRDYVARHFPEYPELREAYNEGCLEPLALFFEEHERDAVIYIEIPSGAETGTGGTPYRRYLRRHIEEIRATKI